jgi:DNA-binding LytR/AlgR family response regulator
MPAARTDGCFKEKFIVKVRNNWVPVSTRKTLPASLRDNLNYLHTRFSGDKYLLDFNTLEEVEELLDPRMCIYRANRQYIVHIDAIQQRETP